MNWNDQFNWKRHPLAEAFVLEALNEAVSRNHELKSLSQEMTLKTSTRLLDWVDHVVIKASPENENRLEEAGYSFLQALPGKKVFQHLGAQLPFVILKEGPDFFGAAIAVDSLSDFFITRGQSGFIEGSPFARFRRALILEENDSAFWAIERRSNDFFEPVIENSSYLPQYFEGLEKWALRPRDTQDEEEALRIAKETAEEMVKSLGSAVAASIALQVERDYWQKRNRAGQVQKGRQDSLGLGWANHDHHTFRSSRRHFAELVHLFEILGFYPRERFYAGEEAGWGAQVMEHANLRLVLFLDVDLSPDEVAFDFAHTPLKEQDKLGTIGLWCALHGDSILKAGMHHLEAQFLFDDLRKDLKDCGIGMMEAFSNFEYLKQAFTQGEMWYVSDGRLNKLEKSGKITSQEKNRFLKEGALGSHLENLQRRDGYKGFNQKNVSFIIKKTDPRKA